MDVTLHPVKSEALIKKAQVRCIERELWCAGEAKDICPIVDRHQNYVLIGSEARAIVCRESVGAECQASLIQSLSALFCLVETF